MKKLLFATLIVLGVLLTLNYIPHKVYSDELDDLTKQISQLQSELDASKQATTPLQSQVDNLKSQLSSIDSQINNIVEDINTKKKNIADDYNNLAEKQKIFDATVRSSYIKKYAFSPLLIFLSGNNAATITRLLTYQERDTQQDKNIITNIALELVSLEQRKAALESEENRLATARTSLDSERAGIQKVVDGAVAYQNSLSGQIAQLSAQQQQLIAQKYASLGIPLYADNTSGGCSSDISPYKDPGFSGTKFGFFTYGVPNRVGLNQYGAFGRAKAGQSDDTILHAYYNFDSIDTKSATINVDGYGSYSLDDYVKRIYEVPDSWGSQGGMEALKAQAIAARSYALAYTNNGSGSICTTQQCQVFKPDPKGGNWEQAVNATAGQVMIQGGNPIKAWFSSTHGGYIHSSGDIGWSSTSWTKNALDASGPVNSFSDLNNNAYDKDSPWFYCDWGGRSQYNNTAWLSGADVADIANVIMLAQKDSSSESHLSQPDKPNPDGTDTWDATKVRQQLGNGAFTNVTNVSISADFNTGKTTTVTVSGDAPTQSFNGDTFKNYFNLRAPSNIQIVGPLYNIEIK